MTMIEIHLLGEMIGIPVKASRKEYENIVDNILHGHYDFTIGDYMFNYNHVIYMEYVEEK